MPVVKLSPAFLANELICPPRMKRIEYCDAECRGLLIEVRAAANSVPTWYVRYKLPKTRYERLGDLKSLSLSQARKAAMLFKAKLSDAPKVEEAPVLAKGDMTLDAFVTDHVNPHNKSRKRSHWRDLQLYDRIGAKFGKRKLSEIGRRECRSSTMSWSRWKSWLPPQPITMWSTCVESLTWRCSGSCWRRTP